MSRRPIMFYVPKYRLLASIVSPTIRDFLDSREGFSNKWIAREAFEEIADEIGRLRWWEKIRLALDVMRFR